MLEYVNSLNQKSRVSRLTIGSFAISCFLHFCIILALYLFPQLLAGGYLHQWRGFRWGTTDVTDEDMEQWRMVAILESTDRMNMPSSETLRELLGRGEREEGAGTPPIEISLGLPEALETNKLPLPQIPPKTEDSEVVISDNMKPGDDDGTKQDSARADESPKTEPAEPGTGKDILAAKPDTASETIVAINTIPVKIPETIQPPAPPPAKPTAEEPAVVSEAGRGSGVGLFDTEGFPMGEYQDIISERVRSKWLIPSNLKNTFGRTAVIFYIDRNGRVVNLRLETTSGNQSLDNAALGAVWGANPFPPLPSGFPGERVGVRLFLTYEP